jgi:Protein of unknown function (DUF2798)
MHIPVRFAPLLFGAMLSAIMVSVISAIVLLTNRGWSPEFFGHWAHSFITTWPIAFPVVLVVAPFVRAVVTKLTQAPPH